MVLKINVNALKKNKSVESIVQFGSSLNKKEFNDIDLCIFTTGPISLKKKLSLLRGLPELYDVSFYDDLPVHIKREVLVKGKIIYTRNYYHLLKMLQYIDDEYPRYKLFLKDYHEKRMATL